MTAKLTGETVSDREIEGDYWRLHRVSLDQGWSWHDGAGLYLTLDEYPEEGSVGAFRTEQECADWVAANDGEIVNARLPTTKGAGE